jgi:hypothetical protein
MAANVVDENDVEQLVLHPPQFFDPDDRTFGLRLWNMQLSKKGAAAKGEVKYVI